MQRIPIGGRRSSLLAGLAVVLALGYAAPTARADFLSDLIASGGSITVGDKVFSHFGYTANSGDAPLASAITVTPIPPGGTDALGNFGIRFGLAGRDNPDGTPTDFLLTYTVSTTSGALLITDVHLTSNLAIAGTPPTGAPFGNIVETISAPGVGTVAQIDNSVTGSSSSLSATSGFVPPGPFTTLLVTKDVQLFSVAGGITTVSFIDQSFSQVPEPSAWLLTTLEVSCAGVLVFSRRLRSLAKSARAETA